MRQTILVVDDDREQKDLYTELFEEQGYVVISADDGLQALELALKQRPDLIFTGIIMPRMDGFELVRNLRNNVATANLPIIMFSHLGREEDRARALQLNVAFMIKGMDKPEAILAQVKQYLGHASVAS